MSNEVEIGDMMFKTTVTGEQVALIQAVLAAHCIDHPEDLPLISTVQWLRVR